MDDHCQGARQSPATTARSRDDRADGPDIHARLPAATDPAIISAIEAFLFRSAEMIYIIGSDGSDEPHH